VNSDTRINRSLHAADRLRPQRPGSPWRTRILAAQLIVDDALLECWSWKGHPELDSR